MMGTARPLFETVWFVTGVASLKLITSSDVLSTAHNVDLKYIILSIGLSSPVVAAVCPRNLI